MQEIETAKELARFLTTNPSLLNRDTNEPTLKPIIMSGTESMQVFTEELKRSGFTNLAEAVAIVHKGESQGEDAKFSSLTEAASFRNRLKVMKDIYAMVSDNGPLFGIQARVNTGEYRVGVTVGEIVFTFYETIREAEESGFDSSEVAGYRAQTLSEQKGMPIGEEEKTQDFILSPMMESMRLKYLSVLERQRRERQIKVA